MMMTERLMVRDVLKSPSAAAINLLDQVSHCEYSEQGGL
jgi:hypothetical protein